MIRLLLVGLMLTSSAICAYSQQRRVAVILYNFENYQSQPYTPQQAYGSFAKPAAPSNSGVKAIYADMSLGQLIITGHNDPVVDVYGWLTIPNSMFVYSGGCGSVGDQYARQLAIQLGYVQANYDLTLLGFPSSTCGYAGASFGPTIYLNGSISSDLIVHEMGHSLGITREAHKLTCRDVNNNIVPLSSNCTTDNYGDYYSYMGQHGFWHHFSGQEKSLAGWFTTANRYLVCDAGDAGTYQLAPITHVDARYLQIARGDGRYYTVESRASTPTDTYAGGFLNGLLVRLVDGSSSYVLDMDPANNSSFLWVLMGATTWNDPLFGVQITVNSFDASGASVTVGYNPAFCQQANPNVYITPQSQAASAGTTLQYSARINNYNTAACQPAPYTVTVTVPNGWSANPSSTVLTIPAGTYVDLPVAITSATNARSKTYSFSVKAKAGNKTHTNSATYTVN